ncbi:TrbC/VirB2 family protein [Yoonia sp. SS1-5]|uniref:TrbC/VirB2 family protein n=1 Tax=Yoonia rhodophyticola TaxID=3137370 RepID=A0AAN0M710_9RHOB
MKLLSYLLMRKRTGALTGGLAVLFLMPNTVLAASTATTGIDASFSTMLTDLTGMLGGNFGALVLLISLIIGVAVYGVTSNWRWVISSVMVAFLIGYGVNIVQGIGGVTATVDMLDVTQVAHTDFDPAIVGPV